MTTTEELDSKANDISRSARSLIVGGSAGVALGTAIGGAAELVFPIGGALLLGAVSYFLSRRVVHE